MNFVARYGFIILIMLTVLIIGILMMENVAHHVNELHQPLSVK